MKLMEIIIHLELDKLSEYWNTPKSVLELPMSNKPTYEELEQKIKKLEQSVDKRKQAEDELKNSEERHRKLFELSRDAIFILDPKVGYIDGNRAALEMFKIPSKEELIKLDPVTLSPEYQPDGMLSAEQANECIDKVLKDGSYYWEWTHMRTDGEEFSATVLSTKLEWGNQVLLQATIRDITERKRVEEVLKQSENKFAKAFHTSPAIMGISDIDTGEYVEVNQAFFDKLGFTFEEVIGKKSTDILHMDGEFRECVVDKLKNQGFIQNEEGVVYDKNGLPKTLLFSAEIIELQNKKYNFTSALDITERKQAEDSRRESEEKYRNVVTNAIEAICVIQDDMFKYFNPEAVRLYGYTEEELEQFPANETVYPEDKEQVNSYRQQREKGEKLPEIYSHRIITKDSRIRWVEIKAVTITWNANPAVLVFLTDITERKKSRELMIQTEKMMSVGGLAAGMAHELNNPLGGMLQGVQNVQRRLSPDLKSNQESAKEFGIDLHNLQLYLEKREILPFLNGIKDSGKKASEIISNMLQFSRKSESHMAPTNLVELMENVLDLAGKNYDLKKKYDFRNIDIIREFDSNLPLVPCTETEIEQVVLNLLNNAAQAMIIEIQKDIHSITIRLLKDQNMARIEIEDNGPGMDETIRKRIFEPFFTTKPVGEGTGLGLSVSYMIITNNHEGTMEVESELGKGTKFIIRLPLSRDMVA